ncbi:MFS transporter [Zavarzinia compransoris]|uniref:MFS transporter n=1 Tax=Zavarzinia marina TaxID=2911065 RepID=UPI001F2D9633|nr:MFS transporter [Zavarzinia marina]MCF4167376.1 MFS transporter [Zavarzinia marina]
MPALTAYSFGPGFWLLFLANFFSFMALEFCFPVVSLLIGDLGGGSAAMGVAMAAMVGAALAARVVGGRLAGRFGLKAIAVAAMIFEGVALILQLVAQEVGLVLVARTVFGIGYGLSTTALNAWVLAAVPNERMGRAVGLFGIGTTFAMVAGPFAGFIVYVDWGGNTANAGIALAMVAVALAVVLPAAETRAAKGAAATGAGPARVERRGRPGAGVRPAAPVAAIMLMSLCYGTTMSFLPVYAVSLGIADAGVYFLVQALAAVVVRYPAGHVQDRRGLRHVLVPGFLFAAGGYAVLAGLEGTVGLFAAAALFGAGFGIVEPAVQAWMVMIFPKTEGARANGLFFNAFDTGMAIGALAVGLLAGFVGFSWLFAAGAVLLAGAALLSTAAVVVPPPVGNGQEGQPVRGSRSGDAGRV